MWSTSSNQLDQVVGPVDQLANDYKVLGWACLYLLKVIKVNFLDMATEFWCSNLALSSWTNQLGPSNVDKRPAWALDKLVCSAELYITLVQSPSTDLLLQW